MSNAERTTGETVTEPWTQGTAETLVREGNEGTTVEVSAPRVHVPGAGMTTLPRVEIDDGSPRLVPVNKVRYDVLEQLGVGGVGEVNLVRDNDIDRTVAMKRLLPEIEHPTTVARFVEEIRTIGRLEHPNIVPIHDVGVDANGRHFFVMKYVRGENLESVITKLASGDPAYHRKYPFSQRVEIFLQVLQAVQYAHANGIIHRDIKPANVMIGAYGEVLLMDWGLAKQIRKPAGAIALEDLPAEAPARDAPPGETRESLFSTRHGSLLGTPAYMSPEQARGACSAVDERSDVYSLCVLFHEFLTLRHYLADRQTLGEVIGAITGQRWSAGTLFAHTHPSQTRPPQEYIHFVGHGFAPDPGERFPSVEAMIDEIHAIRMGKIPVRCPVTFMKRMTGEMSCAIDAHHNIAPLLLFATLGAVAFALFALLYLVVF